MIDGIVLAAAFFLELAALAALGWWGFSAGGVALGIGIPLLVAIVWGTFLSPKASIEIPGAAIFALKALVFGWAAVALLAVDRTAAAELFGAAVVIDSVLLYALGL
jgi:hypothetical protein